MKSAETTRSSRETRGLFSRLLRGVSLVQGSCGKRRKDNGYAVFGFEKKLTPLEMAAALVLLLKPSDQENPLLNDSAVSPDRVEEELACLRIFSLMYVAGPLLKDVDVKGRVFKEFYSRVTAGLDESEKLEFVRTMADREAAYSEAIQKSDDNCRFVESVGRAFARFCEAEGDPRVIATGAVEFAANCMFDRDAIQDILRQYKVTPTSN